jgi:hypothetical protein
MWNTSDSCGTHLEKLGCASGDLRTPDLCIGFHRSVKENIVPTRETPDGFGVVWSKLYGVAGIIGS